MSSSSRPLSMLTEFAKLPVKCAAHSKCSAPPSLFHGSSCSAHHVRRTATSGAALDRDYAFEMACSNIRYGPGVTMELGMDAKNYRAKNALVITDSNIVALPTFKSVLNSLTTHGVNFSVFDRVGVEPTDSSMTEAVKFARRSKHPHDLFIAVGGGSVMDTAKLVNLLAAADPRSHLMDYVVAPIGRGKLVTWEVAARMRPLIAVPTTSGTGSETTGVAIFDHEPLNVKVGVASRALRPSLGLVDPDHVATLPRHVALYSGFDVFCHALESYTALPYHRREPRPTNPQARPAYQGSNPISDIWCKHALHIIAKYFIRAVNNPEDREARSQMHLASCLAGIGFGNAGVHLCHGMSYPISGLARDYEPCRSDYVPVRSAPGLKPKHAFIPHGLSVALTAPAVFSFTGPACPERHLEANRIIAFAGSNTSNGSNGSNTSNGKPTRPAAGQTLADTILEYMRRLDMPDGLGALGYRPGDVADLVRGTLPQERVTKLSPRPALEESLADLFTKSMKIY